MDSPQTTKKTIIGFGSNQGDSVMICRQAVNRLADHPGLELLKVSGLYRTEPVGFKEQQWFVNGAALFETNLSPEQLLLVLQTIEDRFGRIRRERWGPRTLDLDIIAYGEEIVHLPGIRIPHSRMHERRFVLAPMAEIDPDWRHPVLHLSVLEMLARLPADEQAIEIWSE